MNNINFFDLGNNTPFISQTYTSQSQGKKEKTLKKINFSSHSVQPGKKKSNIVVSSNLTGSAEIINIAKINKQQAVIQPNQSTQNINHQNLSFANVEQARQQIEQWNTEIKKGHRHLLSKEHFEMVCGYHDSEISELCEDFSSLYIIHLLETNDKANFLKTLEGLQKMDFERLDLSHSNINNDQLELLTKLPLTGLNLRGCNQLNSAVIHSLLKFSELENLVLYACDWVDDVFVSQLLDFSELESLSLHSCNGKGLTSKTLVTLANMSLIFLDLSYCKWVDGKGMKQANWETIYPDYPLKGLADLALKGVDIRDEDLICLSGFYTLKILTLKECNKLTNAALQVLQKLQIQSLSVSNTTWFGNFGSLPYGFSNLTFLSVHTSPSMTDADCAYFAKLIKLQQLSIYNCTELTLQALVSLETAPSLIMLNDWEWTSLKKIAAAEKDKTLPLDAFLARNKQIMQIGIKEA